MHRILPLLFFLVLATTIPLADALAQSSAGRGAVGGAISAARSAVVEERLLGRSQVRPRGVGGMRVAITTGAMVVAGSARTADRIR
jgi:hypothetical protein